MRGQAAPSDSVKRCKLLALEWVIFSGMALFADKVEKELADEIKLLSAAKK
jgi:hypothetical protein